MKPWYKQKTTWTIIITAASNVAANIIGHPLPAWVNEAALGLVGLFLRDAINTSKVG